jgi:hypothetical protein
VKRAGRALALCALLTPWVAQAQRAVKVRADNDAFNFWQAPWNRPDEEYTSGVRLELDVDGRLPWPGRALRTGDCDAGRTACVEHSYSLGQDIYTGARKRGETLQQAGARPDAGLLWVSAAELAVHGNRVTEMRATLGITGRPALAAPMQRFFHGIAPGWNKPIDWSLQLPTEPVFGVSLDQRRPRAFGAAVLEPHAGASLGTLLTEARGGMGASYAVRRWFYLLSDATARGVARSEVLSGTFFRPSERVPLRPLVTELQFGARGTWHRLSLAWIAHQTSAEYAGRTKGHTWSTLEAEWRR